MWTPLITLLALVLLALITASGAVALLVRDHQHGQRALTLFRLLIGATLGSTGVFAAVIHLHEAGLL